MNDSPALYSALIARDPRFDGVFYVGVTSTGIYCRPICPAKTPKPGNCRFFENAAAAEKANFRPCLRCRPELAPGTAPVDEARRVASIMVQRIDEGMLDDGAGLEAIAEQFGWSSRQIRRIIQKELGVSPIDLLMTRRLLLAKQLLTETRLPITEVAFGSGFRSLRRFNDAFSNRYRIAPSHFRKSALNDSGIVGIDGTFTLRLSYRPPHDWEAMLHFLGTRALRGVEHVDGGAYLRTIALGGRTGWIRVVNAPARRALMVDVTHSLTPVLPALLGRLRHVFDIAARPDLIASHLSTDPVLAPLVARRPGLRVPGAFDGFELAVRAILGQQVTVKGATTLAARYVEAFGESIGTPHPALHALSPRPERVAAAGMAEITSLGVVAARARAIIALAEAVASGRLQLEAHARPDALIAQLVALPGIGQWTAHYIAMRALRWSDAFPKEDIAIRKALGGATPQAAEARSAAWRPWRSYATLHLWGA